jgi:hypothetical protein
LLQKENQFTVRRQNGVETGRGLIQNQNLGIEGEARATPPRFFMPPESAWGMQLAKIRQATANSSDH